QIIAALPLPATSPAAARRDAPLSTSAITRARMSFRIGLRHRPASQNRINADRLSHPSPSENLLDSIGTEHALARANGLATQGKLQSEIARTLGVSVMTLHRWRKARPEPAGPQPVHEAGQPNRALRGERSNCCTTARKFTVEA